jgi:hypothetical protein
VLFAIYNLIDQFEKDEMGRVACIHKNFDGKARKKDCKEDTDIGWRIILR